MDGLFASQMRSQSGGAELVWLESPLVLCRQRDHRRRHPTARPATASAAQYDLRWAALEIVWIVLIFFLFAGSPPPDAGESHYLVKAKHYWDPAWCAGDLFLESRDAHLTYYWTFGWLTRWFSLDASAWIGRLVTWGLLAWSWRRLSLGDRAAAAVVAAVGRVAALVVAELQLGARAGRGRLRGEDGRVRVRVSGPGGGRP